ncbi:MAG: alpha/beta fold hydrolase [Pseudooceanicola sp.]
MGEPLVVIPGMACDARLFEHQIQTFAPSRTVTVALPTQGERMEEIASNLLSQLPPKFALLGVAFGGCVAMEIYRRAPERVQRIALVSTSPLSDTPQQAAERETLLVKLRAGQVDEALAGLMKPDYLAPGPGRFEAMNRVMEMGRALGAAAIERQLRAQQRRKDQQATLRRISAPAMVLCGAHDTLLPVKRHEFMAELIHHAEMRVLDDAGHLPPLETPEAVTEALRDWLKQPLVLRQVSAVRE